MRSATIVVTLLIALAGCSAGVKQKILDTSLGSLNAARDLLLTYDVRAQEKIIENAQTVEDGQAALIAYRAQRDKVVQAMISAYAAIAAAAAQSTDEAVTEVVRTIREVYTLVRQLTGT